VEKVNLGGPTNLASLHLENGRYLLTENAGLDNDGRSLYNASMCAALEKSSIAVRLHFL